MPDPSVIVVGSANTDLIVRGRLLPRRGETVVGGHFFQMPGGKGANQAVAAARASQMPVAFVAALGDDRFGQDLYARLSAEQGLSTEYLRVVRDASSGVALILVDEHGENMISVAAGANAELRPHDIDRLPEALFANARVLLTSLESPLETVIRSLERARHHGLVTILNPAPALREAADSKVLDLVDVLTPNEHELAALARMPSADRGEMVGTAQVLQALGCKAVVATLGPQGVVVVEQQATWIQAYRVKPVDSTAAGDAFNGALAVGLAEGRSLIDAARWANAAAALSVTVMGAQPSLPTRRAIEDFAGRERSQ